MFIIMSVSSVGSFRFVFELLLGKLFQKVCVPLNVTILTDNSLGHYLVHLVLVQQLLLLLGQSLGNTLLFLTDKKQLAGRYFII